MPNAAFLVERRTRALYGCRATSYRTVTCFTIHPFATHPAISYHTLIRHPQVRDQKLATRHVRTWHAAYVSRASERALMSRSINYMTRNAEVRCVATWREYTDDALAYKAGLAASYQRWAATELNSGFRKLVSVVEAESAAIAQARRVVLRLTNQHKSRALQAWVSMAAEQGTRLAAMRAVVGTLTDRSRRAAFNSLLSTLADAQQLRRAREILHMKEARALYNRWAEGGRKYRMMRGTLRRLASRELNRGWVGWLQDYQQTLELLSAANAKAIGFASRLVNLEAARGFAAMRCACLSPRRPLLKPPPGPLLPM